MAFTLSSRAIAPQARLSALPTRRVASVPAAPPLLRSRPAAPASVALAARGGFRAALAGVALQIASPLRRLAQSLRGLTVECNKKKGKGCTLEGTRRKRARVSGFRTRISTPGGLKVLAARRKKGRKVLVPASRPVRWNKQKV